MNEKYYTEKPYSSVPLDKKEPVKIQFSKIAKDVDETVMALGVKQYDAYRRGSAACKNIKPKTASKVVETIHNRYFDSIRKMLRDSDLSEEQKAEQLHHVKEIEDALGSVLKISSNMEKKLDINSVLFTMYGSLNELVVNTLKQYEDR